jgi:hypothetical protein
VENLRTPRLSARANVASNKSVIYFLFVIDFAHETTSLHKKVDAAVVPFHGFPVALWRHLVSGDFHFLPTLLTFVNKDFHASSNW